MSVPTLVLGEVRVPQFLYGTAWKEDQTYGLTTLGLRLGFRGIDTANQRRHYCEEAVGDAIAAHTASGGLREELFLQTKFTFLAGQDRRLPYDPQAPVAVQVGQSFASSLLHLQTTWIDSYLLHGPSRRDGLGPSDWEAWQAMEAIHDQGTARWLGISNVNVGQLRELWDHAQIRPRFVQNRCFAVQGWDREVREFCSQHGIVYQAFSLLTANQQVLVHPQITRIAARYKRSASQIVFRFAVDAGFVPLTGTTSADHMRADLEVFDFQLEPQEIDEIARIGTRTGGWQG